MFGCPVMVSIERCDIAADWNTNRKSHPAVSAKEQSHVPSEGVEEF
jgi:hypothetical protein